MSRKLARLILCVLIAWLGSSVPVFATWTLVAQARCGATGAANTCTTGAIDTTNANVISCYGAFYEAGSNQPVGGDLTDSVSNSYTATTQAASTGDGALKGNWFYKITPTTNASHTFTFTHGTGTSVSLVCMAHTQGSAPTLDGSQVSSGVTSGTGPTTIQAGSLGNADDLVVEGISFYAANGQSIDSSFATPFEQVYSVGNNIGVAGSWKQVSGAANPTWSVSGNNSGSEVALAIAFTGTASGTTCGGTLSLLGVSRCG